MLNISKENLRIDETYLFKEIPGGRLSSIKSSYKRGKLL